MWFKRYFNEIYWSIILALGIMILVASSYTTRMMCRYIIDRIYIEIMENIK